VCIAIRKKKKLSSNDNDATMMDSVSASALPADTTYYNVPDTNRDYYNVNVVDQGSYGQLSDVANDTHTYDHLNKTTVQ